ncbi:enolase-phosphatase E1-like [Carassius carassius]|uniref:enolase-phosphatase E1-like n=1 Tax=Carassius carassius TaxID=217509 RepID=UPI002869628C|nr:enolase-phosphatase E1-like [Carassius carassius]
MQDILFPYILENLEEYLSAHWEEDECKQDVHLLKKQLFDGHFDTNISAKVESKSGEDRMPSGGNRVLNRRHTRGKGSRGSWGE